MDSDIPIFTATRVSCPFRMYGDSIQGAKMTSYPSDLIFEDFMVETSFEFALTGLGGGNFSSFLTSA
jgi:hypothetical protein